MLKVYGSAKSRAFRVLWMLEEVGEPYEHVDAAPHSAEIVARNPSGKVPVLEVEGTALTDSTAILTWLADRHGKLTFPAGTLERAARMPPCTASWTKSTRCCGPPPGTASSCRRSAACPRSLPA